MFQDTPRSTNYFIVCHLVHSLGSAENQRFRHCPTSYGFSPKRANRARRQSGFPTLISCQRQDANVLPKRRQSHQGDKLCDVSTVPLVARWPVFLARGSDADGEPHSLGQSAPNLCSDSQVFHGTIRVARAIT